MDFVKRLVQRKQNKETWLREKKSQKSSSYIADYNQKNNFQKSITPTLSKYQLNVPRTNNHFGGTPKKSIFQKRVGIRSLTPNPMNSISQRINQLKNQVPEANSSNFNNMGHGQHKISTIRLLTKSSKNTHKSMTRRPRNQIKIGSFGDLPFSGKNDHSNPENFDDNQDRLKDDPFIKIPKVQSNYNNCIKSSVRDKFRKYNRQKTFNPKTSFQKSGEFDTRLQKMKGQRDRRRTKVETPLSSASIIKNGSRVSSQISRIWNSKSSLSKNSILSKLESRRGSEISRDLKLDFDVFDKKKNLVSSTMDFNSNSLRSSELLQKLVMTLEIFKKPVEDESPNMKSMFDLKTQMESRRESMGADAKDAQASAGQPASSRSPAKSDLRATQKRIIDGQKKQIQIHKLEQEINNYLKGSPKEYMNSILDLNSNLENLGKEFESVDQSKNQIKALKLKINELNSEIKQKNEEIDKLKSQSLDCEDSILNFEYNLSEFDFRERKNKIKKLKKLDKKVSKYKGYLENLDKDMSKRSDRILKSKPMTIENEIETLKIYLEEDKNDEFLIDQMTKIKTCFKNA